MALKISTSMVKTAPGQPVETITAVGASAGANLDSLKRSLKSMKFIPQLSDSQTYEENELEISRAKSVLDQMAMQAEELMPKEQFASLLADAISASDIEVNPDVHQKLIEHINGKANWKYDVLSMPAPEVDNAREVLDKFLDSITSEKTQPQVVKQNFPEQLPDAISQPVVAEGSTAAAAATSVEQPASDDGTSIHKLKQDLHMASVKKGRSPTEINNEKLNLLSSFRSSNPHLAATEEVKTIDAELSKTANTFGDPESKLVIDPHLEDKARTQSFAPPASSQYGQQGLRNGMPGPNIDLGLGGALSALGSMASAAVSPAKALFKPTQAPAGDQVAVSRQQRNAARSLRKASDDLVGTTNNARSLDEKLESEFIKGGGTVELDGSGKWSAQTVAAMTQDENLAGLLKESAAQKVDLAKKTKVFEREAAKFSAAEAKDMQWSEDSLQDLEKHVDKLNNEVKKGLKSDSVPSPAVSEEDKKMIATLVEMVQKLLAMIKELIRGKKPGVDGARVEPNVDVDNFAPQP